MTPILGKVQLGKELNDDQVNAIVAFLKTLTGTLPDQARVPKN